MSRPRNARSSSSDRQGVGETTAGSNRSGLPVGDRGAVGHQKPVSCVYPVLHGRHACTDHLVGPDLRRVHAQRSERFPGKDRMVAPNGPATGNRAIRLVRGVDGENRDRESKSTSMSAWRSTSPPTNRLRSLCRTRKSPGRSDPVRRCAVPYAADQALGRRADASTGARSPSMSTPTSPPPSGAAMTSPAASGSASPSRGPSSAPTRRFQSVTNRPRPSTRTPKGPRTSSSAS